MTAMADDGQGTQDRRRSPRVMLPADEECRLQLRTRVRLVDISVSGALVETEMPLPVGAKGELRFALAGASFAPTVLIRRRAGSLHRATFSCDGIEAAVQVCVRHVKPVFASTGEQRYLIGVEFVSPSAAVLELIERWLLIHGGEGAFGSGEPN